MQKVIREMFTEVPAGGDRGTLSHRFVFCSYNRRPVLVIEKKALDLAAWYIWKLHPSFILFISNCRKEVHFQPLV